MIADIGGGTTDIAVMREGSIYHTSVLPVAGHQVTRDIAAGLGLSFELAEEMKKKYGNLIPLVKKKTTRLSAKTAIVFLTAICATSCALVLKK